MFRRTSTLALIVFVLGILVNAQDDWHTYPFRDLAGFIAGEQALYDKSAKADMVVSAKPFPSKTRVIYTGRRRAVGEIGLSFMKIWAESRNVPISNVDLLLEEFLFQENGKEYWMPVLKGTAQSITSNLKVGEEVVIYYFYLGGFNSKSLHAKHDILKKSENREFDGIRWLFVVERVERPAAGFPLMQFEEIIEKNKPDKQTDLWVASQQIKAKVKAVFTGELRELKGKRKQLIASWFDMQGVPGASQLMQSEGLFKVEDKEYWIVLRNQTRDHLTSYVKKGGSVFLNTILAGSIKNSNRAEWVFMSGEYSTF